MRSRAKGRRAYGVPAYGSGKGEEAMTNETFTCRDHRDETPTVGGFFWLCLDCGASAMRTGRIGYKDALTQTLQRIEEGTSGLPQDYATTVGEPNEAALVGMMRERERYLRELKGAFEAIGEAIVELEAKDRQRAPKAAGV